MKVCFSGFAASFVAMLLAACSTSDRPHPQRLRPEMKPVIERAAAHGMVDLREFIPGIVVDLKYATADNTTRRPLYPRHMPCLMRYQTAEKLKRAQAILQRQGYQLCVWDAWRPPEVQLQLLREAEHPDLFRDPEKEGWSGHNIGCAIDVTLLDKDGYYCAMPTMFDENSEHTGYHYKGGDRRIAQNIFILQKAMHAAGFLILPSEWWHFDDDDAQVRALPIVSAADLGL